MAVTRAATSPRHTPSHPRPSRRRPRLRASAAAVARRQPIAAAPASTLLSVSQSSCVLSSAHLAARSRPALLRTLRRSFSVVSAVRFSQTQRSLRSIDRRLPTCEDNFADVDFPALVIVLVIVNVIAAAAITVPHRAIHVVHGVCPRRNTATTRSQSSARRLESLRSQTESDAFSHVHSDHPHSFPSRPLLSSFSSRPWPNPPQFHSHSHAHAHTTSPRPPRAKPAQNRTEHAQKNR